MRKGFALPLVIALVVILGFAGFVGYLMYWHNNTPFMKMETKMQDGTLTLTTPSPSQSTPINISAPIDINKITWRKIKSKRAGLSFNYPSVWPIDFENDEDLKRDQDFYDKTISVSPGQSYPLESIAFTSVWIGNAGEDSLGWFIVEKQKGIVTIDDYVKSVDKESEIYVKGRNVAIPRPKIIYSKVGGETAVSVIDQSGLANLSPTDSANDFIVVKNGLIYHLFATPSFKARINAEINAKLFKEIIASVQF